jgi:8-oxo-dGTP pyrophosphatase MutT (NUDIX family)
MHDATKALNAEVRDRSTPNLRPVDAATLILVDTSAKEARILMGKRNPKLKFMPGKFVFPGGRVDAGDRSMLAAGALSPRTEMKLMMSATRMTPQRCRALAMAAIRETFEETGLMIGSKEFADQGLFPTPDALIFLARAITPPRRPRRFDTRFFVAPRKAVGGQVERNIGPDAELTELVWVSLSDAQKLDLPVITQVIITDLAERMTIGFDKDAAIPLYYERQRQFVREIL